MSYYNEPEQRLDPPEMKKADEEALEFADDIKDKIDALHDKAQTFFDELDLDQLQKLYDKAEHLFEELKIKYDEFDIIENEYAHCEYMVEELEGWLEEKRDTIRTEGDV